MTVALCAILVVRRYNEHAQAYCLLANSRAQHHVFR